MATKKNNVNSSSKSNTEDLQNISTLLELLSELNQVEQDVSSSKQKNKVIENNGSPSPSFHTNLEIKPKLKTTSTYIANSIRDKEKNNHIAIEGKKSFNSVTSKSPNNNNLINKHNTVYIPQNSEPKSRNIILLQQSVKKLENKIDNNQSQIDEVIDSVNSLLSLTAELNSYQYNASSKLIIETIVPIIDRIIEQRSNEDLVRMGEVLANILPVAITQQIEATPQSIAKALAPEIALSIQEQVRLDKESISKSIGPEMGKAIKNQIELERDAMVDALYPVIGSTIAKYMGEVVNTINEKVENALSIEGVKRKIRAKFQGVSEAELILQEAIPYEVQAMFLIHKASGLIIRELQPDLAHQLESDLLAGMLTAIQSFANDLISESSGLDEIDYGEYKIVLEVAGYCYLAVVVKGEPSKQFRQKIRKALSNVVLKHSNVIEVYNGDSDTVPESIKLILEELLEQDKQQRNSRSPSPLVILLILMLGGIFIPWGIAKYKSHAANRITQQAAIQLDAAPELSVYRLTPTIKQDKLILAGRVPSPYLRDKAAEVTAKIAEKANLTLENQIVAVNVPVDPTVTQAEVDRVTSILNNQSEITLFSQYQERTVIITGFALDESDEPLIAENFSQIPGVAKIILNLQHQLPIIEKRIYFASGSIELNSTDFTNKIQEIEQLLDMYPELHLRIIGHSDRSGNIKNNQKLSQERGDKVATALINQGIESNRLKVIGSVNPPPGVTANQPLEKSRCVRFELILGDHK